MKKALLFLLWIIFLDNCLQAQKNVGLDNWFNRETNKKTGQPYHYLWNDTAMSGYSKWGAIFTSKGAVISHVEQPKKASLKKMDIYIIVDPDTTSETPNPNYIQPADIQAIMRWVKKGGVLLVLANDAPNCEFTHLNQLMQGFGMTFNHVTLRKVTGNQWEMGAFTVLPVHPIFKDVKKVYMKEISSLTIKSPAKPILSENGQVIMAESKIGKGTVIAIGDPWIYNEYISHDRLTEDFDNYKAAENLTDYLLKLSE